MQRRAWSPSPPPSFSPSVMRLSFGLSLALSLSILLLPYSKSAPLAPLQPSSARSRVRESCISIFFRWSKRGPFGSRSRIPATFPFPGPLCPFLSDGEPGGRAAPRANPLLKTHTRAVPDSFRTMARILAFLLPPCSLSLSLPSLLLPSSFSLHTPPRYVVRSPRRLSPLPPLYLRRFITSSTPLRRYFAF